MPESLIPDEAPQVPVIEIPEFNYEIFNNFFEFLQTEITEKKEFDSKVLEFFKSDEVVEAINLKIENENKSMEDITILKDELIKLNTFLESEKINSEEVRTKKETLINDVNSDINMSIKNTNSLLFIIIVSFIFVWIYKLFYAFIKNFI